MAQIVTDIGAYVPDVIAIGGAVLALIVAGKVFKWVRAAL